jgi:carboxymethylenebutenolidase
MGTQLTLTASDGHTFSAYRADPEGTPRGGIVVIQEIFGVNHHIRSVTDRFAALGYVAIAPALFDRFQPGFESGYSADEVQKAMALLSNPPFAGWLQDIAASREAIASVGKIAVTGFCLGGTLAYASAANLPGFAVSVGYYGGMIAKMTDQTPKVPTLLHFGGLDAHIPASDVAAIQAAQPGVEIHTYANADHGFQCDERGSFNPEAAQIAWGRTLRFIDHHIAG